MLTTPTIHESIRVAATASDRYLRAEELDVPASAMARMERAGILYRVVPGVYIGAQHPRHDLVEAAAWTLRYPRAVACLLTAAIHHDLTDAFARGTWLYVPKGAPVPRSRSMLLQVVQTTPRFIDPDHDGEIGIVTTLVHGVHLRITDPDRTLLDLWRYPLRVSSEYALEALGRRFHAPDFQMPRFARLGRYLGVWSRMEDVVQGMMVR